MGMDVYLRSVLTEEVEEAIAERACEQTKDQHTDPMQAVFDALTKTGAFFRDPYTRFGLLPALGMCWWSDVIPLLVDNGLLPIPVARDLLAELERRPVTDEVIESALTDPRSTTNDTQAFLNQAMGLPSPDYSDIDRDEARTWFTNKRNTLMALLRRSIELNEPLECH